MSSENFMTKYSLSIKWWWVGDNVYRYEVNGAGGSFSTVYVGEKPTYDLILKDIKAITESCRGTEHQIAKIIGVETVKELTSSC